YVPERVVTNADLERALVTTDEWITTRTGIRERRWADPGTSTGDMAVHAGRAALRTAGLDRVDRVVLATTTPDHPCPATAPWVAHRLGLGTVPAHDVGAVCSGFVYALASARDAILAGSADSVLVVGADRFSGIVDPSDRTTAVIFGDGAGAVVLVAGTPGAPGTVDQVLLGSDGSCADHIVVRAGGSRLPVDAATPTAARHFTIRGGLAARRGRGERARARGVVRGGLRLARRAPGEPAHPHGGGPSARPARRQGGRRPRAVREHVGRVRAARARPPRRPVRPRRPDRRRRVRRGHDVGRHDPDLAG